MDAFLLWPLAVLELTPHALAHLCTALTFTRKQRTTDKETTTT